MEMLRGKVSNLSTVFQPAMVFCKTVGVYGIWLLLVLGFTLWFDFRPFGMICAVSLGLFWCRHCATLQLQKSAHFDEAVAKLEQRLANLSTSRPVAFRVGLASAVLTVVAPVHFLPWWAIFATALTLAFFVKWKYEIKIVMSHESVTYQEAQLDLDVEEFLPEENEINQCLLKEVEEQCADIVRGADGFAHSEKIKNAAEQAEELYLNMLIPEVTSNDFESAEHSASSSDEMFVPEGGVRNRTSLQRSTKSKSSETGNYARDKHIEFKASHFTANSSSDSDENISRGLCFINDGDDMDGESKRSKQQNVTTMENWQRDESGPRFNMMSVSSLATNVLMDTVYKHMLDSGVIHHQIQQQPQQIIHSTGLESQNPIIASISNTIRSMRLATPVPQKNDDSTDEDVDSDFEILNSEELNNL